MKAIKSFKGKNYFLSNFYPCNIVYNGIRYLSVETAYQAAKTLDMKTRYEISKLTSAEAKKIGRTIKLRSDWELVKLSIMYSLCRQKFNAHEDLKQKLLDTGDVDIVEGNYWNDTY